MKIELNKLNIDLTEEEYVLFKKIGSSANDYGDADLESVDEADEMTLDSLCEKDLLVEDNGALSLTIIGKMILSKLAPKGY